MKKLVVITALFLLFKPVFPVVEYVLNYDYIANVLCENKARPEMHCNGKCHLMKQLAKASENEKPASQDKKAFSPVELFCDTSIAPEIPFLPETASTKAVFAYTPLCDSAYIGNTFHPPLLA